jgi:hypothetical protein
MKLIQLFKNCWKQRIGLLFIFLMLTVLFGIFSCQHPIEPEKPRSMTLTVISTDVSGVPVSSALVFGAKGSNIQSKELSYWGMTDDQGLFLKGLNVNCTGDNYTIEVRPPNITLTDIMGNGCRYNMTLFCCDTSILCNSFVRNTDLACSKNIISSTISLKGCLDTSNTFTASSNQLTNKSGKALTMFLTHTQNTLPASLNYFIKGTFGNTFQFPNNNSFTLNNDLVFQDSIQLTINNSQPFQFKDTLKYIGKDSNGDTCLVGFIAIDIDIRKCDNCSCPANDLVVNYMDSTCVSSICESGYKDITVPVNFKNSLSKECVLNITLSSDVTDTADISIQSINDFNSKQGITLVQSNSFDYIKIRFKPQLSKIYNDTIVYSVQLTNSLGQTSPCLSKIKIILQLKGLAASCFGQLPNNLNLTQCVDAQLGGTKLKISNSSSCILPIIASITGNDSKYFKLSDSVLCIRPQSDTTVNVIFAPTSASVWPNGRPNPPVKLNYSAILTLNSPVPCSQDIALSGISDTSCGDIYICIREKDSCTANCDGLNFDVVFNPVVLCPIVDINNKCDLYATQLTNNSATLISPNGGLLRYIRNVTLGQNEKLCSVITAADKGTNGNTPTLSVQVGDLFVLKTPGLKLVLWVNDIYADATGCRIICLNGCYIL